MDIFHGAIGYNGFRGAKVRCDECGKMTPVENVRAVSMGKTYIVDVGIVMQNEYLYCDDCYNRAMDSRKAYANRS